MSDWRSIDWPVCVCVCAPAWQAYPRMAEDVERASPDHEEALLPLVSREPALAVRSLHAGP